MKKRPPNKLIKLKAIVQNYNTILHLSVPIHSIIYEVENLIADELAMDFMQTKVAIYHKYHREKLNSQATLL